MKWFKVSIRYAQTINIATIAENEEEAKLKAIRTLKETDDIYGVSVEIMSEEIGADWEEIKKFENNWGSITENL
jgi:hypothetical protein